MAELYEIPEEIKDMMREEETDAERSIRHTFTPHDCAFSINGKTSRELYRRAKSLYRSLKEKLPDHVLVKAATLSRDSLVDTQDVGLLEHLAERQVLFPIETFNFILDPLTNYEEQWPPEKEKYSVARARGYEDDLYYSKNAVTRFIVDMKLALNSTQT